MMGKLGFRNTRFVYIAQHLHQLANFQVERFWLVTGCEELKIVYEVFNSKAAQRCKKLFKKETIFSTTSTHLWFISQQERARSLDDMTGEWNTATLLYFISF
ncbi:hypothetical protein GOODEAATRI_014382 [Goodea atripinnis]|uniref:Uncharacterized protein n=1 Tax=Goodea atripinnis TaxID=208336 RepID=A0ABV0P433_9TELE